MDSSLLKTLFHSDPESPAADTAAPFSARIAGAVPWLLLVGFAAVLFLLFGERFDSGLPVKVETIVTTKSQSAAVGTEQIGPTEGLAVDLWSEPVSFQASGWIEPGPYPIQVSALVDGFIEEVLVLEGESVKRGQVIARLLREDFELDLATAQGELDSARAEAEANEKAILAVDARIATRRKEVRAGRLKLLELEDRRDRLVDVSEGAVSAEEVRQSELRVQTFRGELDALEISAVELVSERARLVAMRAAYQAKIRSGETELARRQLALDRTEIRAPVDGVVMRLFAVPGRKRMMSTDDIDSSTIATLYQPDRLQVRIDVPLGEAAAVFPGQAVRIRSDFLPGEMILGTVSHRTGEADLQRNTLQVKVLLKEPDSRLRPEMLCRAEFLQSPRGSEAQAGERSGRVIFYVPVRALFDLEGAEARVWVVDRDGERIESRALTLGSEERGGYRFVTAGLQPGDRVVLDPTAELTEGTRIEPITEGSHAPEGTTEAP